MKNDDIEESRSLTEFRKTIDVYKLLTGIIVKYNLFTDSETQEKAWEYLNKVMPEDTLISRHAVQAARENEIVDLLTNKFYTLLGEDMEPDIRINTLTFLLKLIKHQQQARSSLELLQNMDIPDDIKNLYSEEPDINPEPPSLSSPSSFSSSNPDRIRNRCEAKYEIPESERMSPLSGAGSFFKTLKIHNNGDNIDGELLSLTGLQLPSSSSSSSTSSSTSSFSPYMSIPDAIKNSYSEEPDIKTEPPSLSSPSSSSSSNPDRRRNSYEAKYEIPESERMSPLSGVGSFTTFDSSFKALKTHNNGDNIDGELLSPTGLQPPSSSSSSSTSSSSSSFSPSS